MTLVITDPETGASFEVKGDKEMQVLNAMDNPQVGGSTTPAPHIAIQTEPGNKLIKGNEEKLYEVIGLGGTGKTWPEEIKSLLWAFDPVDSVGSMSETEERIMDLEIENVINSLMLSNKAGTLSIADLEQIGYRWKRIVRRARKVKGAPNLIELLTESHIHQKIDQTMSDGGRQVSALDAIKKIFHGGH